MLQFIIPAKPIPAARPRVFGGGRVAYPKTHYQYKGYLEESLPKPDQGTIADPVEVHMTFVMPRYKTSDYPTSRTDLDNLEKIVLDAMTKVAYWADDSLVVAKNTTKRFVKEGEEPMTIVTVKECSPERLEELCVDPEGFQHV